MQQVSLKHELKELKGVLHYVFKMFTFQLKAQLNVLIY